MSSNYDSIKSPEQQIQSFAEPYIQFSSSTIEETLKHVKVRKGLRGSFLWREGEHCKEFVIIAKGCTRLYFLSKETENTIWFGFPDNLGSELQSFVSGQPSKFFVEVIEDLEYLSINKTAFDQLLSTHEEWQLLIRRLWEDALVNIIDRIMAFQCQSATERYLELIKNPNYLQMIPQKYLASYLGITQTSLSRLRKKITDNTH